MIAEENSRLQVTLKHETIEELQIYAFEHGMTKSELIAFLWLYFKSRKEVG